MSYRVDSIPNIRTIKALRGDSLRIDLGKEFPGLLTAWMKRDPNDLEYRSFEIQNNRYLYLSEEKTSDWTTGSEMIAKIEGKWYFDLEQDMEDGSDKKTIYRGTIFFYNDITNSGGQEAIAPPDNRYRTIDIVSYLPLEESISGEVETQKDINIEFVNEFHEIRQILGEGAILTEDVPVIGVGTVGGLSDDDIVQAGTELTDFAKRLLQKVIPATYTAPTSSLGISVTGNQEVGTTYNVNLTPIFNQNDGGAIVSVIFRRNGSIIHTQSNLSIYSHLNQVTQAGSNSYQVEIVYESGTVKNDNFGNPSPIGQIQAGSTVANNSFNGVYYNWHGSTPTLPTIGSDIRSLLNTFNNSFTLNTENVNNIFVIAIPSTRTLQSVIDIDALNVNLTSNYIQSNTITTVPDAQGNPVSYKVYILQNAIPYSTNHRHNIIIS